MIQKYDTSKKRRAKHDFASRDIPENNLLLDLFFRGVPLAEPGEKKEKNNLCINSVKDDNAQSEWLSAEACGLTPAAGIGIEKIWNFLMLVF